jgi:hypothetical protein
MILGNFVVAFGYQHKWRWEVIVLLGYTCAGIQVAALPAMATTYAIDSYKPVAGSVMVAATVNKVCAMFAVLSLSFLSFLPFLSPPSHIGRNDDNDDDGVEC